MDSKLYSSIWSLQLSEADLAAILANLEGDILFVDENHQVEEILYHAWKISS